MQGQSLDGQQSVRERSERHRRTWRIAFGVSLLVHLLVFLLWRSDGPLLSPFAAAGPRSGDNRAAAGSMQAMNIRTPPPVPIVPPPVPLPSVTPPEPIEFEERTELDESSLLGERPGTDEGPGLEEGEGEGDAGTAAEGFFRLVPPSPRGMIMPPSHEALRGKQVQVWVFVNEHGRVVADSTRLEPPTRDRSFNQQLLREAAQWVFEPARKGGEPVAAWFPYTISM